MSYSSSSGTSEVVTRARNRGVPTKCWCGASVVTFMSTTKENPYRRFYRCGVAMERKKENHLFTWVEDALIEEIRMINVEHRRLVEDVEDVRKSLMEKSELQKVMFEKMEEEVICKLTEKLEKELVVAKVNMERVGREMANSAIKRMSVVFVVLCLLAWLYGWIKI